MFRPFLLLALTGCGFAHRNLKFFGPEQMVIAAQDESGLVEASLESRRKRAPVSEPEVMISRNGRRFLRPVTVTEADTVVLHSEQPVELEIYSRGNGLFGRHDFSRIHTITGSIAHRYPNEVALLPTVIEGDLRLSIEDLSNPFNNRDFEHGDLLLIVARLDGRQQKLFYKRRDAGFHIGGFGGILATIPLTDSQTNIAPILAGGPTFGWRTPKASGPLQLFDTFEVVFSGGVGSTALQAVAEENLVEDQLSGLFNAGVAGAGVRLFRIISVQGFVNVSQFFREAEEAPAVLAVGLDAAGLANATKDIFSKLFRQNPIKEPPPR